MGIRADNAVIMAAGSSSRFAPLSYEIPKGLLTVRGEVLIERQIRQLHQAGIDRIQVVVGYRKEKFEYLSKKFGIELIENPDFKTKNNPSSLWAAREFLKNTYVCSSDNYFVENPFEAEPEGSYYAAAYVSGPTEEWCLSENPDGTIRGVTVGGENAWVMLGHTFWSESFSRTFLSLLEQEYDRPEVYGQLWEHFYRRHLEQLPMKARHYPKDVIFEFDSLEELRAFDPEYREHTHSTVMDQITTSFQCSERELTDFTAVLDSEKEVVGCRFLYRGESYIWKYRECRMEKPNERI